MKKFPHTFIAADGYRLGGSVYKANNPKATLVIAGATGVPQWFYDKFAQFATTRDFEVITFDYRGIGLSKSEKLKGFEVNYLDWARQDLACVVDFASKQERPICIVGHSYGGHAIGLLPNHSKVSAAYTFGTGAGWHGWMPMLERLKVWTMWNIFGPLIVKTHGFLAWSKIGMGENLPLGVYKDWKRWCSYPNYFFDDPKMPHIKDVFSSINLPIAAANSTDDKWAPPTSRDAFMHNYRNAELDLQTIDSTKLGLGSIGHMGYFRSRFDVLWPDVLDWCESKI